MKPNETGSPVELPLAPLSEKIALKRARRLATMPRAYRRLFERCWSGKASPRASVKAFCLDRVGFERPAIIECTAIACPLWRLRPYQVKERTP